MTIQDAVSLKITLAGVQQVEAGLRRIKANMAEVRATGQQHNATLSQAGNVIQSLTSSLGGLAAKFGGPVNMAITAVTAGVAALTSQVLLLGNAMQEFEKFKGIELMAQSMFGDLQGSAIAKQLQAFSVPSVYDTRSINKLGIGLAGSEAVGKDLLIPTLQALTDALAGTGVTDNAAFSQAARAFEQIAGGKQVRDEELNQQLRDVAPALLSILRQEAAARGQVLGGKDSMSSADFFQMIRELGEGRFKGAQEKLVSEIPSLRFANIMQSLQNKLIPIGEKVARLVLPVLDKFDQAMEQVFASASFKQYMTIVEDFMGKLGGVIIGGIEKTMEWFQRNDESLSKIMKAGGDLLSVFANVDLDAFAAAAVVAGDALTGVIEKLGKLADILSWFLPDKPIKPYLGSGASGGAMGGNNPGYIPNPGDGSAWGGNGRDAMGRTVTNAKAITRADRNSLYAHVMNNSLR